MNSAKTDRLSQRHSENAKKKGDTTINSATFITTIASGNEAKSGTLISSQEEGTTIP